MSLTTQLHSAEPLGLDGRSRQIVAALKEGFLGLDADWRVTECNSAAERLLDRKRQELLGRNFFEVAGLGPSSALAKLARRVATTKEPEDAELTYPRDGRSRLIAVRAFPLDDGIAAVWRDITGARAAERRLARGEAQYREIADGVPTSAWLSRADGKLEFINHAMADILGRARRALLGDGWLDSIDPEDRERLLSVRAQARTNQSGFHYEGRFRRPDGALRLIELQGRPRFDATGAFRGHVGVAEDVTVAREADRRQRLLIDELNHRVKNTLAIVQALVRHTLHDNDVPTSVANAVADRLIALAAAHDVLSREHWESADVGDVIAEAMRPYADRISISGPKARVSPKAAIALAMGLSELATNAAKHGALTTADGRVEVGWTRQERAILLEWREHGGPSVAPPQISGFGSLLLGRALAVDLGRPAEMTFEPDGLICRLWAPIAVEAR